MARYQDITGLIFGRLTAQSYAGTGENGGAQWLCSCDCGSEKVANAAELKRGNTRSCGCLAREQKQAAGKARQHAYSRVNMYRERKSWENMIARCYVASNKMFAAYGGRGITVCDKWRESFVNFVDDMGPRPLGMTIDRKDNSLGYSPENCQWAGAEAQANNRRNNRFVTVGNQTLTVAQWAREKGVRPSLIHTRLFQGWSEHDAVMTAVGVPRG